MTIGLNRLLAGLLIAIGAATAGWAVGNGLITGRDGKLLAPRDKASRAETAMILMRLEKLAA